MGEPAGCEICGFDTADYDRTDAEGTRRSFAKRWEWMHEGVAPEFWAAKPTLTVGSAAQNMADVLLELTTWAQPCRKIAGCVGDGRFDRVDHDRHPGMSRAYAAMLRTGRVAAGDPVVVES